MLNTEQQIFEQIKKAKHILISFNKSWRGDSVASALAFFLLLKKMEKKVDIVAEKFSAGDNFNFLPKYTEVSHTLDNLRKFIISLDISNAKVGQIKYKIEENTLDFIISPKEGFFTKDDITSKSGDFKYDLVIVLDTPDLESLGKIYDNDTEFFYQVPVINIDHHSYNEEFGQINQVEITATSTAEILFNLITYYSRDMIDEDIATCLLAGIISKTRNYKIQSVSPHSLSISSQLIAMGARREEIVNKLYRSRPLNVLKLWGRVLARLKGNDKKTLVWSILSASDFAKTNTNSDAIIDVIDELIINIPEARVVSIIYEDNKDGETTTKALVYSIKNINSLEIVKEFKPIGTRNMTSITLRGDLQSAEKKLINTIEERLNKLNL